MIGLGLGIDRAGFAPFNYFKGLPSFVKDEYSLAFSAEGAEKFQDYDTDILYFRDSNFNRVAAAFSRTTTATRVNKQGLIESVATGVPRIDYSDGSAKLLMEPSRTNIALYSEDFTQVTWLKTSNTSITANTGIAPDGTQTADTLTAGQVGSQLQYFITSGTIGQAYTVSFYIRRITGTGTVNIRAVENVNTPISVTSSWQRYSLTATSTTTTIRIGLNLSTIGDEIEIWGAQLEEGSYPTSYIPTAGSAVTRNADDLALTGIASKIGQSSGSVYFSGLSRNSANGYFSLSDGTITNRVQVDVGSPANTITYRVMLSGSTIVNETMPFASNTDYKFGVRYSVDDFAFYANGTKEGQDNLGNTFGANVLTDFYFSTGNAAGDLYGTIDRAVIFPTALTDSELQQLTS